MLSRFFFRGYPATQFQVLNIPEDKVLGKLYIQTSLGLSDITHHHCIVCVEPFTIAVIASGITGNEKELYTSSGNRKKIKVDIRHTKKINTDDNGIMLFEIMQAQFPVASTIRLLLLRQTTQSKISKDLFKKFAAFYTIPRKVVLISFSSGEHFNIFPMDFVGYFAETNVYLFGLRTSNITLEYIIKEKKLLAAEFECNDKELIYQLGKHHSSQAPSLGSLTFDTYPGEAFGFPVPVFASGYSEISITDHISIGSHTLLVGRPVFESKTSSAKKFCHIDTIEFLTHSHWYSPFLLR